MIDRIIEFSIRWRLFIVLVALGLVVAGVWGITGLPIDAVPDVTTNQVQVNTVAPSFTPAEMEQYVTFPVEVAMSSLPRKQEVRSISQFGLSQVTITFPDDVDIYQARQLVLERLIEVGRELPAGVTPTLAPVSTGLGEIVQFSLRSTNGKHSLMELRTLLDWFVKPQLRTVPGVIEVNGFGGQERQYEVLVDPSKLVAYGITLKQVIEALEQNNANVGGGYLEQGGEQQLIRGVALVQNVRDIENIVVSSSRGTPVYVQSVAEVRLGAQLRQGAATQNGQGETVVGVAMLLKGENSRAVAERVADRLRQLDKAMPAGVKIDMFYNRSALVDQTIHTAVKNLIEGGLVVVAVLFLFLLQVRAGLIVSSAIPLAMLVAILGMRYYHISANLMSLGAIDFGLVVDAAVIIVENCVRRLALERRKLARALTGQERRRVIFEASVEVRRASQFGEILIIAAYLPIVSLVGIEGKMFRPMAFTVILALAAALVLSLTVVPALAAMFLREPRRVHESEPGDGTDHSVEDENPFVRWLQRRYRPLLRFTTGHPSITALAAGLFVIVCAALFQLLGAEFLPKLEEGALAINSIRLPSVSLTQAVKMTTDLERVVGAFPEVATIVSRIGRPEIATDPMGPNMGDTYVFLKPKEEWTTAHSREELVEAMERRIKDEIPGMGFSFSQPIEFRMQELIEGVGARSDIVIKIFGEDLNVMREKAEGVARALGQVPGAADVKVQQVTGLPLLQITVDREAISRYGINAADVQELIRTAIAGTEAGTVLEGFRRFGLIVRLKPEVRQHPADFASLLVGAPNGQKIPLAQLARIDSVEGPFEIAREDGQRRITIEVNVRGRDVGSFVGEAQRRVDKEVQLPSGYLMQWGGLWEHLESGRDRLLIVVPITFALIFLLLFATFGSAAQAALVFTGIPFAVTGGILALLARGMPFSMSAGVGFIAVSGVAVLNGLVMVAFINEARQRGEAMIEAVRDGALTRLRPVLMTASVASFGFLPMALSTGGGAEVQRPLATVVIGGLVTSTVLTLLVLPAVYPWFSRKAAASSASDAETIGMDPVESERFR